MEKMKKTVEHKLSKERFAHTMRVLETALEMGEKYGVDAGKIEAAVLLHDYGKAYGPDQTREKLKDAGIPLDEVMEENIDLAHGLLGAWLASREFGIEDPDILNAIRYHTFGREAMSPLEKIVFLADYIEPGRQFEGVERVRSLALRNLDEAMVVALEQSVSYVTARHRPLHPLSLKALAYLKGEKN
ncbi:MAG: hypothetical protein AVO33_08820 [delta proteobacterium ML8_F1]|nr:MAG: hypothetical protein AVO33_08820 [delta proteobacterium ML8_F1]